MATLEGETADIEPHLNFDIRDDTNSSLTIDISTSVTTDISFDNDSSNA